MKILVVTALVLLCAAPAMAQVDIRTTPPEQGKWRDFVTAPSPYYDTARPRENDWYPHGVRVPFDPAFITPMSVEHDSGRFGVAGWTAQNIPVGAVEAHHHEQNGWLMFGFAYTWGAPPRPAARPAAGTPRPATAPAR